MPPATMINAEISKLPRMFAFIFCLHYSLCLQSTIEQETCESRRIATGLHHTRHCQRVAAGLCSTTTRNQVADDSREGMCICVGGGATCVILRSYSAWLSFVCFLLSVTWLNSQFDEHQDYIVLISPGLYLYVQIRIFERTDLFFGPKRACTEKIYAIRDERPNAAIGRTLLVTRMNTRPWRCVVSS